MKLLLRYVTHYPPKGEDRSTLIRRIFLHVSGDKPVLRINFILQHACINVTMLHVLTKGTIFLISLSKDGYTIGHNIPRTRNNMDDDIMVTLSGILIYLVCLGRTRSDFAVKSQPTKLKINTPYCSLPCEGRGGAWAVKGPTPRWDLIQSCWRWIGSVHGDQ